MSGIQKKQNIRRFKQQNLLKEARKKCFNVKRRLKAALFLYVRLLIEVADQVRSSGVVSPTR